MLLFAYYLLKVIICSGILYGYYLLALRNKIFHGWNRFYLLSAVILSLVVPLIKIDIFQNAGSPKQVVQLLQVVSTGDEFVYEYTKNGGFHIDATNLSVFIYVVVSIFLLVILIQTLVKIAKLKKNNNQTIVEGVNFINTKADGTPFSFFNNIFWNDKIDINTTTGKQIFKHEVAHVQEKHSYDKIFINIVLIFFWCNPFFWLMRKELNIIHEFIADKKALEDSDTAAFAAMILQATYPLQKFTITNNFFYSPLKRRLAMLTKNKNPNMNYASRLLVLPLAALVFFAFTLKVKKSSDLLNISLIRKDTMPVKTKGSMIRDSAIEINADITPSKNDLILRNVSLSGSTEMKADVVIFKDKNKKSLEFNDNYIIINNGKEFSKESLEDKLKGKMIRAEEIKIYPPNNAEAIKLYGDAAKNGAMVFTNSELIDKSMQHDKIEIKDIQLHGIKHAPNEIQKNGNNKNDIKVTDIKLTKANNENIDFAVEVNPDTLPKNLKGDKVFTKVEFEPSFPGGEIAWTRYITKIMTANIDELAKENKSGTCRVRFIVDVDGSVRDVKVLSMQGTKLAEISENAIRKGPKWVPAKQNGHVVTAYREQPITFTISEN
ncbi:MAG TPA: M56 family metallopeptidase [Chitinophagaceae bacterium]|nr:M56 family metallopeptidase [Chitinophagaceae bacterium]